MYIFIDKRFIFKQFFYESCFRLSFTKEIWYIHLSRFLNNKTIRLSLIVSDNLIVSPNTPLHQIFIASLKG